MSEQTTISNWLKDASIKRLNIAIQNKKENFQSTATQVFLIDSKVNVTDLSESGLSKFERDQLVLWTQGNVSGRQCFMSILDNRYCWDQVEQAHKSTGNLRPIDLLTTSVSLPRGFISASASHYLYNALFSKPPKTVIREALQLLTEKAKEKTPSGLNSEQINIALKQMQIQRLSTFEDMEGNDGDDSKENSPNIFNEDKEQNSDMKTKAVIAKHTEEQLRVQVLIELIRIHIQSINNNSSGQVPTSPSKGSQINEEESTDGEGNNSNSLASWNVAQLGKDLNIPLQLVLSEAETLSMESLETNNTLYKSYLKQLAGLKATLSTQLKDLEDSKAYLTLGVSKDSSDSSLKKAYHSMAIKLHPDKPGGDTAKFQKLQDAYQEITKQRRQEESSQAAINKFLNNPAAQAAAAKARGILNAIGKHLELVKNAADFCTDLAQRNIKWIKKIEKRTAMGYPKGLNELMALVKSTTSTNKSADLLDFMKWRNDPSSRKRTMKASAITMANCSVLLAVDPCEEACGAMQELASTAMALPGCGMIYGLTAASNRNFMQHIEKSMSMGLTVLQCITALMTADQQLASSISRLDDNESLLITGKLFPTSGGAYHDVAAIHEVSMDLLHTAFSSASVTMTTAANRLVSCALMASEMYKETHDIIEASEREVYEDAKRRVLTDEEEQQYSADDLEELRKHRHQQAKRAAAQEAEAEKEAETASAASKVAEEGNKEKPDAETEEAKKQKDPAKKMRGSSDTSDLSDELEDLRDKIKQLQIKLRVQNVQVLQTLNSEARELQKKLQLELVSLATETSNLDAPLVAKPRVQQQQQMSVGDAAGQKLESKPPMTYRQAIFSLLAECIDCSCHTLRQELIQLEGAHSDDLPDSRSPWKMLATLQKLYDAVRRHLGWMLDLQGARGSERFQLNTNIVPEVVVTTTQHADDSVDAVCETKAECKSDNRQESMGEEANNDSHSVDSKQELPTNDIPDGHVDDTTPSNIDIDIDIDIDINLNFNIDEPPADIDRNSNGSKPTAEIPQSSGPAPSPTIQPCETSAVTLRLALLPDYRSRTLWLASLLDRSVINGIVGHELQLRLSDHIKCIIELVLLQMPLGDSVKMLAYSIDPMLGLPEIDPADQNLALFLSDEIAKKFCVMVLEGVELASSV